MRGCGKGAKYHEAAESRDFNEWRLVGGILNQLQSRIQNNLLLLQKVELEQEEKEVGKVWRMDLLKRSESGKTLGGAGGC